MKYIKLYESFERKDIKELVDEILDNLSRKKSLSDSEREFMNAASKDEVYDASIPKLSGNFWADISNPHNISTMWMDKNKTWKVIKSLEEEKEEEISKTETDDQKYHRRRKQYQEKYVNDNPGLKETLNEYLELLLRQQKELYPIAKKLKSYANYGKNDDYVLSQKIEYALKGLESLYNQFEHVLDYKIDDNGQFVKKIKEDN